MRKLITLLYVALLLISSVGLEAQNDSLKNEYQKEFDDFLNSSQQAFNTFQSKNDSIFYNFLKQSWKEFRLMEKNRPAIPTPEEQPVMKQSKSFDKEIKPAERHKTILEDSGRQIRYNNVPGHYNKIDYVPDYYKLNFYGAIVKIPKTAFGSNVEGQVDQHVIAEYFKNNSSNETMLKIVDVLSTVAVNRNLNGYGFLKLLQQTAGHYYNHVNDQVLFTWLALLKAGYNAKVGYNSNNIYLFVDFDIPVFYYPYFESNGKRYYLFPFNDQLHNQQPVASFPGNYPGAQKPVSLVINHLPALPAKVETRVVYYNNDTVVLQYNENLKTFYDAYPDCDLSLYFPPSLSKIAVNSFDNYLKPLLSGKTEVQKINLLLDFLQKGFPYAADEKQFGKEKYLFAEETVAVPYSDCEDRAILLSHLIGYFTKLETIGLVFSDHVTLAVKLHETIQGTYIKYNGSSYYICDPTFIGSKLGMIMPEYAESNPEIINFARNYNIN